MPEITELLQLRYSHGHTGSFTSFLHDPNYRSAKCKVFSAKMTASQSTPPVSELDPLHTATPLPYQTELYPFGFPVSISSNQPAVLDAARESWSDWRRRFATKPLEVACIVAGAGRPDAPMPTSFRARRNLFVSVADDENFMSCDLATGFALVSVTLATVARAEYLRYHFLEAAAYSLLDTRHTRAVHAACVALDGYGVLLAGDSGAGKSSLAYACARRGWTYVSDDATSVVRRSRGRTVLGSPRAFRFRDEAGELFPEFSGMRARRRGNGKPTIEIATESLPEIRTSFEAHVDYVVFLNRHGVRRDTIELVTVTEDEALRRLYWQPWPSELKSSGSSLAAVKRLLRAKTFEMRYRELDSAVDRLEQLVRGGSR